jgi:hypothetical protein
VILCKWANGGPTVFSHDQAVIKSTNVVLSLTLTRVDLNMVVTARVLDKDNGEAVLFQRTVVDTPKADPTLSSADLLAASGMKISVWPDSGPMVTSGNYIFLSAGQYTDGKQPEVDVTYGNLEVRTSEIPPVTIERAALFSWPASATINYTIQGAPTVQGSWLPIQDWTTPGLNQMTVPAGEFMIFFRLVEAP